MKDPNLKILILSDGKIGDLVQCRGVAALLAEPENISETVVKPGWLTALPLPYMPLSAVDRQSAFMSSTADMIIAAGRRTIPYLRALKARRGSSCFTVFLKDPKIHHDVADVIWAPQHDQLSAPNGFSTPTSPHGLTPDRLAKARRTAAARFEQLSSPNVGIILGGTNKSVSWSSASRQKLVAALNTLETGTNVLVTASRRTPKALLDCVHQALQPHNSFFWSNEETDGPNPYVEILAFADRLIVTGDSYNMVSEAVASGSPVHVFRPDNLHQKFHQFLDGMEASGVIEDVSRGFDRQQGVTVDATPEICDEIMRRFAAVRI